MTEFFDHEIVSIVVIVLTLLIFSFPSRFVLCASCLKSFCAHHVYRRPQENANWLRKVSLMKNPHFRWYQTDALAIWPNHEVVILTKFHKNWTKIDNFSLIAHFLTSSHSPRDVCTISFNTILINSNQLSTSCLQYHSGQFWSIVHIMSTLPFRSILINCAHHVNNTIQINSDQLCTPRLHSDQGVSKSLIENHRDSFRFLSKQINISWSRTSKGFWILFQWE